MNNFIEAHPLVSSLLKLVYLSKLDTNAYIRQISKYGNMVRCRLHRLAESIPWNRSLGSLNVYKFGLCSATADKMGGWGCDEAVSEKTTLRCGLLQKYLFYGWFLPNSGITLHPYGLIIFILTPSHVCVRKFHWSLLL